MCELPLSLINKPRHAIQFSGWKKHLLLAQLLILVACSPAPDTESVASSQSDATAEPVSFDDYKNTFIESFWQLYPEAAVYNGRYEFAGQLTVPDASLHARELAFWQQAAADLETFEQSSLDAADLSDWHILAEEVEAQLWYLQTYNAETWDPSLYNVAGIIGFMLNTDYTDRDTRLLQIGAMLERVPAFYQSAQQNLEQVTLPHTELAIQQNEGADNLLTGTLIDNILTSSLTPEQKQALLDQTSQASAAIQAYVGWLEQKLPALEDGLARDFRIGGTLYADKFRHDLKSGFSAEQAYARAVAEKDRLHGEMLLLAEALWPKYFPDQDFPAQPLGAINLVIGKIAEEHASPDNFVNAVIDQIPELETFVVSNNLLTTDPEKPLVVRATPEYQRGFAVASIESPGPYDSQANTYYNVEPLDDYAPEDAESFLREYNSRMMQILNIHEAIPGHYTQLVHANKSPSLVKAIFGNGTMIEGWAVYTERMMLEAGYGNFEPELWLMYYKWNLRTVVNTILDYEIQVQGMTEDEALDLLMNQAFQEQAEATGKWRRATLSQVQLASYFTGYAEIYAFAEEERARLGEAFDPKTFHDTFLSFGSAPIPVIKELMRGE